MSPTKVGLALGGAMYIIAVAAPVWAKSPPPPPPPPPACGAGTSCPTCQGNTSTGSGKPHCQPTT
jgi:hypothetical protein